MPRARGRAGSKDGETGEQEEYRRDHQKARAPEDGQAESVGTRVCSKGVRVQVGSGDKGKGSTCDPADRGLLICPCCAPCRTEALTAPGTALTLAFEIFPQ